MAVVKFSCFLHPLLSLHLLSKLRTLEANGISSSTTNCPVKERQALLRFKAGLKDPSNQLSSWTGQDCCEWDGVSCDNCTGRVVKLDLRSPNICDMDDDAKSVLEGYKPMCLSGQETRELEVGLSGCMNSSLEELDLSANNFNGSVPANIDRHTSALKYLDVSNNSLTGNLPCSASGIKNLVYIDLSNNALSGDIYAGWDCYAKTEDLGSFREIVLW
ncbi:probable inactive receptor kinase At5g10020 [Eucalyptus grandis]|uniref:probable inactive receptor kinase At5g10020 n=1 Tax=Eucalyptus grandis TaxID=71139 RepID=UPI00192EBF3B|nr:probable inactive receptor kinase At5g10020 [Eucalyptus grandis]